MDKKRKDTFLIESLVVLWFVIFASWALIHFDFFDWWFDYTRAHENWEMDEVFSIFFAVLLGGAIMAVRYIFALKRVLYDLDVANKRIMEQEIMKNRQEKMAALGRLSSGLAHEINNALQPIVGLGKIIRQGLESHPDKKYIRYMDIVENGARHACNVIADVLNYAHESNAQPGVYVAVDIFHQALDFSKALLPASITFELAGFPAWEDRKTATEFIRCDKTGIFQVFSNILKNAADAMNDKGVIYISLSRRGKDFMCVTIEDSGHGIDPENLERIFDPFFTTKEIEKGTGLGLSTVQGIMHRYGGSVSVQSQKKKGSTFTLLFPLSREEEYEQEEAVG